MIHEQLFISELFKDIQDAILFIFHNRTMWLFRATLPAYLPYWMCVQSSFYHQLWINTWRSKFEQWTVFFLLVDLVDKEHKDPEKIDLEAPRLAQYMHKAWKKHQNTVFCVDVNLALKKGLVFPSSSLVESS